MCLTTKQEEPFIATKNIVCFKFLKKAGKNYTFKYRSPFYVFPWSKGVVEETDIVRYGRNSINQGFHAYRTRKITRRSLSNFYDYLSFVVRRKRYKIKKFIIPKGSEYYISECGTEIVSNKIKMK